MADRWYCNLQGREIGPLQLGALVEMSRKGSLHPDDLVRRGERGVWVNASTVTGLFSEGEGLEAVNALEELSIEFVGSTDEPLPGASPPLPTIESGEMDRAGMVSADPDVINDMSELNFEFADGSPRSVPGARQLDVSRPHSAEVAPVEGWYCEIFGQTMGPMPFGDLKRMVDNDELSAKDRVREGESGTWVDAVSVSGLIPEDDFELAPTVVVSSPDDSSSNAMSDPQQPDSATPNAAKLPDDTSAQNAQTEPPLQPPVSSNSQSSSVTESSSTTDLNKWLNEETADAAASRECPPDETMPTMPKEAESSARADADEPVVAVPRKDVSRPPKPARPRRSLGELFAPVAKRGKLLAMIGGGILIVGLLVMFFVSNGPSLFSHDKEYYEAYLSLYNEFRSLRDQQAPDAQWSSFIERANQQNKTRLEWLETAASPKYPARQFLLFVARDNWPAMVSNARHRPSMDEWRLVTNLQSAHSRIDGSTVPPEPPKVNSAKPVR